MTPRPPTLRSLLLCLPWIHFNVSAADAEGYWDGRFSLSTTTTISAIGFDAEQRLLATGLSLSMFGQNPTAQLARWDGRTWTRLPMNVAGAAFASHEGRTYFSRPGPGGLFEISGTNLVALSSSPGFVVSTLAGTSAGLVAGGSFRGTAGTNVSRWTGSSWAPIGSGVPVAVSKLLSVPPLLFAVAGSDSEPSAIWSWNGTLWQKLPALFNSPAEGNIGGITWWQGELVAGLEGLDQTDAVKVLRNGAWVPVPGGRISGRARSVAVIGERLIAVGRLHKEDGNLSAAIFASDGEDWAPEMAGTVDEITGLAQGPNVVAAWGKMSGSIGFTGSSKPLLLRDRESWRILNSGPVTLSSIGQLQDAGDRIVATGAASSAEFRQGVSWDGRIFRALATTRDPQNRFLNAQPVTCRSGGEIYAVGIYATNLPAEGFNAILKLSGTNWIPATPPFPGTANAITADDASIIVAGGDPAVVRRWNGSTWSLLGADAPGRVNAVRGAAIVDGAIHVAGSFQSIGGAAVANLARWSGSAWQPPPGGSPNGPVTAFDSSPDGILIAGNFTSAGGVAAPGLATFDGKQWRPLPALPSAISNAPVSIARSDSGTVAVGGVVDGRYYVCILRNDTWTRVASDRVFIGSVEGLLWRGRDLYAGGGFLEFGGIQSHVFAVWHEPGAILAARRMSTPALKISITGAVPPNYVIERATGLSGWQPRHTNTVPVSDEIFTEPFDSDFRLLRLSGR